jgi:hypothetical protein
LLPGLLSDLPGLVVPEVRRLAHAFLAAMAGEGAPSSRPLLGRPTGSHGGIDLVRIEDGAGLAAYLAAVPADDYYVSDYWDYRSGDGNFRKYRLVFVDREVLPYHLAISQDWLVHYWRADMRDWMKAEEAAFLADYRAVFADAAGAAVRAVAQRLDLDYGGIDCALLPDGRVLLFEANATMLVNLSDAAEEFPYKHEYVPRIRDAMSRLVVRRCAEAPAR